jgi:hypothetical protein
VVGLSTTHHSPLTSQNILGVWWSARDPAKVEDQVRFLTRILLPLKTLDAALAGVLPNPG